ncbi:ribosomal protein S5 domain 2-type protein [Pavlovales sp. CCMP2436]|nr:ribosomal protein S5 domain 2-type protein [Pavlovales sp. CCMP2436]
MGLGSRILAAAALLAALGSASVASARSRAPAQRAASSARGRVALSATEPRELTSDGDFHMWSPEAGVHKLSVKTKGWETTFETGRIAKLAGGAVLMQAGDNVLFASACFQEGGKPADFVPLKVDYQERYSAGGITPGGYIKRDGRPGDTEILTSRLIDRPIRPTFPKGWSEETQIISYVLSYDGSSPPDCMAVCASAAALSISDVPFASPVACVRVTRSEDGAWKLNAPMEEQAKSDVTLVVAGTASAILMIEGFCKFVPEAEIVEACAFGHEAVRDICNAVGAWQEAVGKPKANHLIRVIPENVAAEVERMCEGELEKVLSVRSKQQREAAFEALQAKVESELTTAVADTPAAETGDAPPHSALKSKAQAAPRAALELADVQLAFQKLATKTLRQMVASGGPRPDGRKSTEVRPLSMSTKVLPRTHGSALFTRGETQSLATVTLGDSGSEQKFEGLTGSGAKRFYLQYSFPPFSVGEVGRFGGAPGRRERFGGAPGRRESHCPDPCNI